MGRFISPDPFVSEFTNPQNLNRYAYVDNNPVNHIDPSGFKKKKKGGFFRRFFGFIVGIIAAVVSGGAGAPAIVAGAIGGATAGAVNTAINGGNPVVNILGGALLGAIAGGLGPPLAQAYSGALGGFGGAVAAGAVTGAVVGAASTAIYGGNFGQNVGFGALGGAITAAAIYGGYKAWELLNDSIGRHADPHRPGFKAANYNPGDVPAGEQLPTLSGDIGSGYTSRHPALDISCSTWGCGVYGTGKGVVVATRSSGVPGGLDNFVQVRLPGGYQELYSHVLPYEDVGPGTRVIAGRLIGTVDMSGTTSGPHVHYELRGQGGIGNLNPCLRLGCQ